MNEALLEAFTVRSNGSTGQVVLDPDGKIVAWTTDVWLAQVITQLLNENESLLFIKKEIDKC
jgi:hypothetical protein